MSQRKPSPGFLNSGAAAVAATGLAIILATCDGALATTGPQRTTSEGWIILAPPEWLHGTWQSVQGDGAVMITFTDDNVIFFGSVQPLNFKAINYVGVVEQSNLEDQYSFRTGIGVYTFTRSPSGMSYQVNISGHDSERYAFVRSDN